MYYNRKKTHVGEFWKNEDRKDLSAMVTEDLKKLILKAAEMCSTVEDDKTLPVDDIRRFRVAVFSASWELSKRGIAPRWQGIIKWRENRGVSVYHPQLIKAIDEDFVLYDLVWLWHEFGKKVKPNNRRWVTLFQGEEFDMELACSIADRQVVKGQKIEGLNLTGFHQVGCLKLIKTEIHNKITTEAAKIDGWERREAEKLLRQRRSSMATAADAPQRALKLFAAKAVRCSQVSRSLGDDGEFNAWTDAARVFGWLGGGETDRANMRRTLLTMGRKV